MTPWRKVSRMAARLSTLRYAVSLAPGSRSGFTGSALPAVAMPKSASTWLGPVPGSGGPSAVLEGPYSTT